LLAKSTILQGGIVIMGNFFARALVCCLSAGVFSGSAVAGTTTSTEMMVGVFQDMKATLFMPDGTGPFPTILLMHTSGGLERADLDYCDKLAQEGFICIAPEFLRAYAVTNETRRKSFRMLMNPILEDFRSIIGMLDSLPKARRGSVGAIGFSNGGFFALLLAATGSVKVGVSYYGALNGAGAHPDLAVFENRFTRASAPVLVLAGENDSTITMGPVLRLEKILKASDARHELKVYPNAGHGFDRSAGPSGNYASAQDAWRRTRAFLKENLK